MKKEAEMRRWQKRGKEQKIKTVIERRKSERGGGKREKR